MNEVKGKQGLNTGKLNLFYRVSLHTAFPFGKPRALTINLKDYLTSAGRSRGLILFFNLQYWWSSLYYNAPIKTILGPLKIVSPAERVQPSCTKKNYTQRIVLVRLQPNPAAENRLGQASTQSGGCGCVYQPQGFNAGFNAPPPHPPRHGAMLGRPGFDSHPCILFS
jgi:hypothetical protein